MMPRRRAWLVVAAAFGIAAALGAAFSAWAVHYAVLGQAEVAILAQRTEFRVHLLEMLRDGEKLKLVDTLERKVDNYVRGWEGDRVAMNNARTRLAIEKVRAYRSQYPRATDDPAKDAAVKRVLEGK